MPTQRHIQPRGIATRTRLLEAALRQFSGHGYAAASVDEICSAAGVSKGAFYHHFESKQALFLTLLDDWLMAIDRGLADLRKPGVPASLVHMTEILPSILAAADARLPMFLEFWLQASRDESVWRASIEPYRRYQEQFISMIRDGIAEGSFGAVNSKAAGQLILSMAIGILLQALLDPEREDWEKTAREGMEIILKGLAN